MSNVNIQTPFKFTPEGKLEVQSEATIVTGDLEIGAVELKDATTDTRAKVKSDGTDNAVVVIENSSNILAKYRINDTDTGSATKYYGFTDRNGAWYILRESNNGSTYRYACGTVFYSDNWNSRTTLGYTRFDEAF
ncbi:MAG: hypothetical protein ACOYWZ_15700 [Bacillota bacterium]